MLENKWLIPIKAPKKTERLLFTFHYAAASASIFYPWRNILDENTKVYAVELPGRGTRYEEEPISDIKTITMKIAEAIRPHLGSAPVTFFGHSMGGLLAYETAILLSLDCEKPIDHFIASAVNPPGYRQIRTQTQIDDEIFKKELIKYGGIPDSLLTNIDFWDIYLPTARVDFAMVMNYTPSEKPVPLNCNITAIVGKRDDIVKVEKAKHWKKLTKSSFNLIEIDGGHLFIKETKRIVEIVNSILLKDYRKLPLSTLIHEEGTYVV
ncbi:MAG: hypothetical protein BGO76_09070 [Caedibacter sp. 38-128]|nr:thioesterase [Holosporales bacterium]OJX07696.1 MAG: hypothetical protein BGO76_09070 [Caedibacter sp. 38-128]